MKTQLTNSVPEGTDHREDRGDGQQRAYVVLTPEERATADFVRPVRLSYVHTPCGGATYISKAIAETIAREPYFYAGTFCSHCRKHFPVGEDGEFVWDDGSKVGT